MTSMTQSGVHLLGPFGDANTYPTHPPLQAKGTCVEVNEVHFGGGMGCFAGIRWKMLATKLWAA